MSEKTLTLLVFVIIYLGLIFVKNKRALVIWIGLGVLVIFSSLSLWQMICYVNWNVLGIFAGTLILAEYFIYSKVPVLLAHKVLSYARTAGMAFFYICIFSSFLSVFLENVAVVLIVAPIVLEICRKLRVTPVPVLIGIAISSNLQGTALLIGDPPSMILAGELHMNFNDFIFFEGRPSIFFAVQVGAIFSYLTLYFLYRKYREPSGGFHPEKVVSWVPMTLMGLMIVGLVVAPVYDPDFLWLSGVVCMVCALAAVVWGFLRGTHGETLRLLKRYDWDTTFFLAGVFILVHFLNHVGAITDIKEGIVNLTGDSVLANYNFIVWLSVFFSAFICNVPYVTAMLQVTKEIGIGLMGSPYLFSFGLLIGACLGGNITPIGASANIVAVGLCRRDGHAVSFPTFMRFGVPFTLSATLAGALFIWFFWGTS